METTVDSVAAILGWDKKYVARDEKARILVSWFPVHAVAILQPIEYGGNVECLMPISTALQEEYDAIPRAKWRLKNMTPRAPQ